MTRGHSQWIPVPVAALILECSYSTVYRLIDEGQIRARQLRPIARSHWRVSRRDVESIATGVTVATDV